MNECIDTTPATVYADGLYTVDPMFERSSLSDKELQPL